MVEKELLELTKRGFVCCWILILGMFLLLHQPINQNFPNNAESRTDTPVLSTDGNRIVIDYSHGQYSEYVAIIDQYLASNLTAMGFEVVYATQEINSTILEGAVGFFLGSLYSTHWFDWDEVVAITEWFNSGDKFLWVGCDSDFTSPPNSGQFINDNMTLILEAIGSHVYPEPTSIEDPYSNTGALYRVKANTTTDNPMFFDVVNGVNNVLFHGPTCLYGSDSETPGAGISPVALESESISHVHPLLYYGEGAVVVDGDIISPIAHNDGDIGSFVATTIELNAGEKESSTLVVSGSSPYGWYHPMYADEYYGHLLDGNIFINQLVEYAIIESGLLSPNPRITEIPEDAEFYYTEWDRSIHWVVTDEDPSTFEIYLDGLLVHTEPWSYGEWEIEYPLDSLGIGEYNITLNLIDLDGNRASDTVWVTIIEDTEPPVLNSPPDRYFVLGTTLQIEWIAEDNNPCGYQISINGSVITAHEWTYSPATIGVAVDNWVSSPGMYVFELLVTDCVYNVTDTVLVHAFPSNITFTTQFPPTSVYTTGEITMSSTTPTSSISTTTVGTSPSNSTTTPWWNVGEVWQVMSTVITIGSIVIMIVFVVLIIRSRK